MSSSDERSPKRQRRSFSPASPPELQTKPAFVQPPQTPPPSVRMSPSWNQQPSQLPGLGHQLNLDGVAMIPSPTSTTGFHSQNMTRGASSEGIGSESEQPAPAVSVENERKRKRDDDDEGSTRATKETKQIPEDNVVRGADTGTEHKRSDHEREDFPAGDKVENGAKVLYKLPKIPIVPSRPHPSQDMIRLYGLEGIQASVARQKKNGEKNPLRKSYQKQLDSLKLEGRNKAEKGNRELEGLLDSGWDEVVEEGKTLWEVKCSDLALTASSVDSIAGLLDSALNMRPGRLPKTEHNQWNNVLGLDEAAAVVSKPPTTNESTLAKTPITNLLAKTTPASAMRNSAPASPRNVVGRPERANKKRRYDESSYSGYSEGYGDDGYSSGGIDDAGNRRVSSGAKRQKRKDFGSSANSPPFTTTGGSSNMVGVRSS